MQVKKMNLILFSFKNASFDSTFNNEGSKLNKKIFIF